MVADIKPGTANASSYVDHLTTSGDYLYFTANDGIHGSELWATDLAGNTFLVRDINPGSAASSIDLLTDFDGRLYFVADDGVHGRELWTSDGSAEGTSLFLDFFPVSEPSGTYDQPYASLAAVDHALYFALDTIDAGTQLWTSDGTAAGTTMLRAFDSGQYYDVPGMFTAVGDHVIFSAGDTQYGQGVWATDGTPSGTVLLTDINMGLQASYLSAFTLLNGQVYFQVMDYARSRTTFWTTDGTPTGTHELEIPMGLVGFGTVAFEGQLYFGGHINDGSPSGEYPSSGLWKTDGTAAGTVFIRETPGFGHLQNLAGKLYFALNDGVWTSDGTAAGTQLLTPLPYDDDDAYDLQLTEFNGQVYFKPWGSPSFSLWKTNGTPEGTGQLAVLVNSHGFAPFAGSLYFSASDRFNGQELWRLSGAATVAGRHAFYNNSAFDGNDPGAESADDDAIAPDKVALLPGDNAIFTNYTTYDRGINGVMVDIDKLGGTPTAVDFEFRVGRDDTPDDWILAPAPLEVSVRRGAGIAKSDRVTFTWADGSIVNQWLEVTVKATAATGLAMPDVFYFGNAVGDTLNHPFNTIVNAMDEIGIRNHLADADAINDQYDINRDGAVNAADELIARLGSTSLDTALPLIRPMRSEPEQLSVVESRTLNSIASDVAAPSPIADRFFIVPILAATAGVVEKVPAAPQLPVLNTGDSAGPSWSEDLRAPLGLGEQWPAKRVMADGQSALLDEELLELLVCDLAEAVR
jgi:ELWxxDGT repeat protein